MMGALIEDLRTSSRSLRRNPAYAATVVALLVAGISISSAILTMAELAFLRPLPFREDDRLFKVWETWPERSIDRAWASPPNALDWGEQVPAFERLATFQSPANLNLSVGGEVHHVQGSQVSSPFFATLGVEAVVGRTFVASDPDGNRGTIVVSHGLWRRVFGGDPEAIGSSVLINGKPWSIVGVMPETLDLPRGADLWLPLDLEPGDWPRTAHFLEVLVRLKRGVEPRHAQAALDVVTARLATEHPDSNAGWGARLVPLRDEIVGHARPAVAALSAGVVLVLLLVCANASSLVAVRTVARGAELALREVLGANRRRLIRQFLVESVLVASVAALLALPISAVFLRWLTSSSAIDLGLRSTLLDGRSALLVAGVGTLTGLAYMVAALRARPNRGLGTDLHAVATSTESASRRHAGDYLFVANVSLCVVLLVGSGLLGKGFLRLLDTDLGFRSDGVLTARLALPSRDYPTDEAVVAFHRQLEELLGGRTGVRAAGVTSALPLTSAGGGTAFYPRDGAATGAGEQPLAQYVSVSERYFELMGIALLRGRTFRPEDRLGAPYVVVINDALARRYWPGEEAVGREIYVGLGRDAWYRIVGVVGDIRQSAPATEAVPTLYLSFAQHPTRAAWLALRTAGEPEGYAPALREDLRATDPHVALFEVKTMERRLFESIGPERFVLGLAGLFSTLTLLLTAAGIYGVLSYRISRQARGFGIRIAMGAPPTGLVVRAVARGATLTGLGLGLGLLSSLFVTRPLARLLFEVPALDPVVYLAAAGALTAVTLLATYIPARRIAAIDPQEALRTL